MIYGVYAVRDFKTGFMAPTVDVNDASAIRNFEHAVCGAEQSLFFSHPEDYALFKIGDYDADSGLLVPCSPVVELLTATQVLDSALARRLKGGASDGDQA